MAKNILVIKYPYKYQIIINVFVFVSLILYTYIVADPISNYLGARVYKRSFVDYPIIVSIVSIALAPVIEELIFRLHLSGERRHFWSFPIMLVVVFIAFRNTNIYLLLTIFVFIISFSLFFHKHIVDWLLVKYYSLTFVFTSFCFAMVHVTVIDSSTFLNRFIIAITAIFPLSIFLGFVRKKYGLIYSIASHAFYNMILLTLNSLIYH